MKTALIVMLLAAFGLFLALPGFYPEYNMTPGVTDLSRRVYDLHNTVFLICCVIAVLTFSLMFYAMIFHRHDRGYEPATWKHNIKLEFVWTAIPAAILITMAVPATKVLWALYDTGGEDLTIEVRGYQWKWQYKYLDEKLKTQVSFFSNIATSRDEIEGRSVKGQFYLREVDEPLVIPVRKKVRFLVTSNDVIHSWWVPEFGVKRDAIPGIINDIFANVNEPGVYRGQCTELCGKDHGFMPIVVRAVTQPEFDKWYAGRQAQAAKLAEIMLKDWTSEELMANGAKVYGKYCVGCHQPNGKGMPPAFPSLADSDIVHNDKAAHMKTVYFGRKGTAMQAFGKQLNPIDLASVIHYERHSWGNNSNDITLPKEIMALGAK